MKTVIRCSTAQQAYRAQMLLDSVGIQSFIPDEMIMFVDPPALFGGSGIRVQVADEEAENAAAVLADFQTDAGEAPESSTPSE